MPSRKALRLAVRAPAQLQALRVVEAVLHKRDAHAADDAVYNEAADALGVRVKQLRNTIDVIERQIRTDEQKGPRETAKVVCEALGVGSKTTLRVRARDAKAAGEQRSRVAIARAARAEGVSVEEFLERRGSARDRTRRSSERPTARSRRSRKGDRAASIASTCRPRDDPAARSGEPRRYLLPTFGGMTYPLSAHDQRRLAVAAYCDLKTLKRYFADPESVRSTSRSRIERGLVEIGLAHLVRGPADGFGAAQ